MTKGSILAALLGLICIHLNAADLNQGQLHIVRDSGKDYKIAFSSVTPSISVTYKENGEKAGTVIFRANHSQGERNDIRWDTYLDNGGSVEIKPDYVNQWTVTRGWEHYLTLIGTVDLGEGDDIYFKHFEGNTVEYWHYSLINPRKAQLVDLCFTFWHHEPSKIDNIVSGNFSESSLSREREFLIAQAKKDGYQFDKIKPK
jgi:hypothetical protein